MADINVAMRGLGEAFIALGQAILASNEGAHLMTGQVVVKKEKKEKKEKKKRNPSAYNLYMKEMLPGIKERQKLGNTDALKLVGAAWKELNSASRARFEKMAKDGADLVKMEEAEAEEEEEKVVEETHVESEEEEEEEEKEVKKKKDKKKDKKKKHRESSEGDDDGGEKKKKKHKKRHSSDE